MPITIFGSSSSLFRQYRIYSKVLKNYSTILFTRSPSESNEYSFDLNIPTVSLSTPLSDSSVAINFTALTSIPYCQTNPIQAVNVNGLGPLFLSRILPTDCHLIHISTDMVYDGAHGHRSSEDDVNLSNNMYSKSKFIGEQVIAARPNTTVLRLNYYYHSMTGSGLLDFFLKAMITNQPTIPGFTDIL